MAFRVSGTLDGSGEILMDSRGYFGNKNWHGNGPGKGFQGAYSTDAHLPGGGAGHAVAGERLTNGGVAGESYGHSVLDSIYMGSSGGAPGNKEGSDPVEEKGGPGGGIIFIAAENIDFSGNIHSNGGAGEGRSGDGSGGSIRLEANTVTSNVDSVAALGGPGLAGTRAYGGDGRVAVYYQSDFSGNFTPDYLAKGGVPDIISSDDFENGELNPETEWSTTGSPTVSQLTNYSGKYGVKAVIETTPAPVYLVP